MRGLLILALLALAPRPAAAQTLSFVAFGDVPYCRDASPAICGPQLARVEALVRAINAERPAFSIFLGDAKSHTESCEDAVLLRSAAWFAQHEAPLVFTPGDNDWADCFSRNAGRFHPPERLAFLRQHYFAEPRSLGAAPMALERQSEVMPAQRAFDGALFVENARWAMGGLRFVTLHVTGSNNNLPEGLRHIPPATARAPAEFAAREAAARAWLADTAALAGREGASGLVVAMQADIYCERSEGDGFTALREAVLQLARQWAPRPLLLLTGDGHYFLDDRPERGVNNLRRIMVPGEQDVRAVLITHEPGAAEAFRARLVGGAADAPRRLCR